MNSISYYSHGETLKVLQALTIAMGPLQAFGLLHVHEVQTDATSGRRKAQQSSARGRRRSARASQ